MNSTRCFRVVRKSNPECRLWILPDEKKVWATESELRTFFETNPVAAGLLNAQLGTYKLQTTVSIPPCDCVFEARLAKALCLVEGMDAELQEVDAGKSVVPVFVGITCAIFALLVFMVWAANDRHERFGSEIRSMHEEIDGELSEIVNIVDRFDSDDWRIVVPDLRDQLQSLEKKNAALSKRLDRF